MSEQTPSDELARKMRHHSGRSEYGAGGTLIRFFVLTDLRPWFVLIMEV